MVVSRLRHVELPHDKKERWLKLRDLYSELEGVQRANDLVVILQKIFEEANNDIQKLARDLSKDAVDSFGPNWHFKGLEVFLDEIATKEESDTFFKTILPFIITLASGIEEFAPSEGILLCSQQQGRNYEVLFTIMSLLCCPTDIFNFMENNRSRRTLLVGDQGFNLHPFWTGS